MMIFIMSMIISTILLILTFMLNFISKKSFYDREKNSPFECGFDPKNLARLPFSLHFFLIAIIFIIFDVELTLFLPFILIFKISNLLTLSLCMSFFIIILLIGLFHEQNQGSLDWTN
nr:NADH dehydrogenase subunit 3 [Ips subelongatus]UUG47413.1 NADH dehydrogenase subunit 3 [Ips subelongatus]UUG47517.1 NADH dehydrogenase subunit 3 [Ips subelongatus]UUG47582.1 NADH dehydrogenase subunit 3 [Ips subelongatus]UUG47634.1 NADH dehydrogenase subunit 3 [Ips subelongatus]